MKKIFVTLFLVIFFSITTFSSDSLLVKYWNYKQRFLERNVRIGTEPGMSMPVESYWHSDCRWDWIWWDYPWDSLRDGRGVQNISGDQTVYQGQYWALLATEYGLLKINNQDTDPTLRELYYALKAYYRLEQKANDVFHTSGYTGFFMRTDAPNDFYTKFQDDFIPDERKPKCTLAEELKRTISPDSLKSNMTSQDQVIHLLFGLAMIKRFVPSDVFYNGENVLDIAQDIARRMVKRFYDDNWNLRDPAGLHLGNERGGEAMAWAYGMDKTWAYISDEGKTFGQYYTKPSDIALKTIWDCCAHLGGITHFYNRRLYISLVTSSNLKPVDYNFNYTFNDGMYIYPLAQAIIFNQNLSADNSSAILDTLYKALFEAPAFGPCISVNGWNPDCPMTKGWMSQNRWLVGDASDRDTISETNNHPANQNGTDYMLAYNLYKLYTNPNGYYNTNHPVNTGLNPSKNQDYDFSLFPNPINNSVNIKLFIPKPSDLSIKFIDLYGQIVLEKRVTLNLYNNYYTTQLIFPSGISSGVYICNINLGNINIQKTVVKL